MTDEELREMLMKPHGDMAQNWPNAVGELLNIRAAVRREREARQIRMDVEASVHMIDIPEERLAAAGDHEERARALVDRLVAGGKE